MQINVGSFDRLVRAVMGAMFVAAAVFAPLPLAVRVGVFGMMGVMALMTAATGSCLVYRMLGKSTCPLHAKP